MKFLKDFFKNVRIEMKKVTWPTMRELGRYTWVVIWTMLFFGVFFTLSDFGISEVIKLILE